MDSTAMNAVGAIMAVIAIALFARSYQKRSEQDPSSPRTAETEPSHAETYEPEGEDDESEAEDFRGDDADDAGHVIAVTSSGNALVPDGHVVRMLPPEESGEEWKVGAGIKSSTMRAEKAFGMTWSAGDLRGTRVARGAADEGAWVLETLGRDGEYIPFDFETLEAAEAAKQLFERQGVVEIGEDEDGNPAPPSREQFEEARRIYRETLAELSMDEGEEPR